MRTIYPIRQLDDDQFYVRIPKKYVDELGTRKVYFYRRDDNALLVSRSDFDMEGFERKSEKTILYSFCGREKRKSYYIILPYMFMALNSLKKLDELKITLESGEYIIVSPVS